MNIYNFIFKSKGGESYMPHLFQVTIQPANETRTVNVVAETAEEAQAKAALAEGETVTAINDAGEVTV